MDSYEGLPYSRRPNSLARAIAFFSELKSDIFKRSFRRFEHHQGIGLHLDDPTSLREIPNSLAKKTVMLSIHSKKGNSTIDINDLARFKKLRDLTLGAFVAPKNIASLSAINSIRRLVIQTRIKDVIPFSLMESLQELSINGGSNLAELHEVTNTLKALTIDNLRESANLAALQNLEYLGIIGTGKSENLRFLSGLSQLRVLELTNARLLQNLDGIQNCAKLTHLQIEIVNH